MLQNKLIGVTRPQHQGKELVELLNSFTLSAIQLPLISILAENDHTEFQTVTAQLASFDIAIFISENAVLNSLPFWQKQQIKFSNNLQVFSIGNSTAKSLEKFNLPNIITAKTDNFSSEHLLELPALQAQKIKGKKILLIKGYGGRNLIADNLLIRGAQVIELSCYRRCSTDINQIFNKEKVEQLSGLIITSSESIINLNELTDKILLTQLQEKAIFVIHQNIAKTAESYGYKKIVICKNGNQNIAQAVYQYFNNLSNS